MPNKSPEDVVPFNYLGTPALTQTTAPGNVAYYHYYLTNKGNIQDTYKLTTAFQSAAGSIIAPNGIEVYYDANGNGQVDAGDILLTNDGVVVVETPIVAQDATIPIIVAVKTPTSAADETVINTDLNGASDGALAAGGSATDAISNWNQTVISRSTGILTATKAANVSSAAPGDVLTYTVQGSNTGSAPVYGEKYANIDLDGNGTVEASNEGILIIDELDPKKLKIDDGTYPDDDTDDFSYAGISGTTVDGPSKAKILYWNQDGNTWHLRATDAEWQDTPKIVLFIPADVAADPLTQRGSVLTAGQGYKFSFKAAVQKPYGATEPKLIENKVEAEYYSNILLSDTTKFPTESNKSMVTVGDDPLTATPGAAIGPFGWPKADHALTDEVTKAEHPVLEDDVLTLDVKDRSSAGVRNAGEVIAFPLTILNPNEVLAAGEGSGGPATLADTYNITVSNPDPDSFSVVLYKSDGTTPLADTNGDGKPDTGSINPADVANIVVKVYIKADADIDLVDGSDFTVTATSSNNGDVKDTTLLHIEQVLPAGVDIAVAGQLGKNDNASIDTYSDVAATNDAAMKLDDAKKTDVVPGDVLSFAVQIANIRPRELNAATGDDSLTSIADTYKLTYEKIDDATDATPFTVQLYKGNGSGGIADGNLVQISDTGWLAASTKLAPDIDNIFNLTARVQVPMGTPKGDYFIKITATSTNNPDVEDHMHLLVRVIDAPSIEVTPDNTATVIAGGSYIFRHVVTNTGNVADTVKLIHGDLPNGYSAVWVDCGTGAVVDNISGAGTNASPSTWTTDSIGIGESIETCLKVFVPANAASGSVVPITVTGTMVTNSPVNDTALDIITVIDGALQLIKSNVPTTEVPPAGTITYTTDYKNLSAGVLTNAYIADAIPAHTTLTPGSVSGTKFDPADDYKPIPAVAADFEYSEDNGVSWVALAAISKKITNVRLKVGSVPAGESGKLVFSVKVD
ncbi:MAG: hypothetical protein ACOYI9_13715 [Candidatus Hydrogenedentales bacterium]